jgi:small subunit ribosomal protein S1
MAKDDFASMFESTPGASRQRQTAHVTAGQRIEGTVLGISAGLVSVDIGGSADATIELIEFDQKVVKVGDRIVATVAEARWEGSRLTLSLGRGGGAVSADVLRLASESGTPVTGTVSAVVKGGFSVDIAGVRAFCPISQIDLTYVSTPEVYVGQTLDFRVVEFKEGGRNVVVSRRRLLDEQRKADRVALAQNLHAGSVVTGTVQSINKHGIIVDIGGLDGFIHISELSRSRVSGPEDVAQIGETVTAQVLSVEQGERGLSVRLSLKALAPAATPPAGPPPDQVVAAEVVRHVGNGLIVATAHGEGLVPTRELALPPGADHRRTYPVGRKLDVVLVHRDAASGRLRFSVDRVEDVVERNNFRDFGQQAQKAGALGSLGELMAAKFGGIAAKPAALPQPAAPVAATPVAAAAAASPLAPTKATPRADSAPSAVKQSPHGVTRRR